MQPVKLVLSVTLTDSMSIISTPKDLNGMRSLVRRSKITTQLLPVLGVKMAQKFVLDLFVVQLIFSKFVLKNVGTKENLNLHMSHFHKFSLVE
jgi:hypothetical protein